MIVSYNWLKEYLGNDIPSPEALADQLTFHSFEIDGVEQVGEDTAIDIDVLPNRSSDCLSHRGIARELATLLDRELAHDPLQAKPELPLTDAISITIEDTHACPRFTAALIEGVKIKESPQWLQERLATLGQRSINNIVDATNYVMFALGQPLHAYDADKFPQVDGSWRFVVRPARAEETVSLLAEGGAEEERILTLQGGELLVVDGSSDTPIGLAGVKGGQFAGVDESTSRVIVEAAHFHPTLTRKTARSYGIVIDASKRFENEPSRELPPYAQDEIIKLIIDIAGGECQGFTDMYPEPKAVPTVSVHPKRVNALLGLALTTEEMVAILTRLGIAVATEGEVLMCTGPWERTDLTIEEDFIEEIGRVHGYQHVASVTPIKAPLTEYNPRQYYSEKIRQCLLEQGYSEVITSSFRKKDDIALLNAMASDKGCLRSTLTKNITEVLDRNAVFQDLLGMSDTRVFEIGTVFKKGEGVVTEHVSLCIGLRIKPSGYSQKEDKVLDALVAELETQLATTLNFTRDKGVIELDLSAVIAKLPVPTAYEPVVTGKEVKYEPFSVYPSVSRDIAMWVPDDITPETVKETLEAAAGPLWVRTTHIDSFSKEGRTSYAFRLVFQSKDKTLTDAEVNNHMEAVYDAATKEGWETR